MLVLSPTTVSFGGERWEQVTQIAIDREAVREVTAWSDLGPHVVFADVPEQRVKIKVVMDVPSDANSPVPGRMGTLMARLSPSLTHASGVMLSARAVVVGVTHEIGGRKGASRTVELIAVSADGASDPIVFSRV
jgi:hypothetical protein